MTCAFKGFRKHGGSFYDKKSVILFSLHESVFRAENSCKRCEDCNELIFSINQLINHFSRSVYRFVISLTHETRLISLFDHLMNQVTFLPLLHIFGRIKGEFKIARNFLYSFFSVFRFFFCSHFFIVLL